MARRHNGDADGWSAAVAGHEINWLAPFGSPLEHSGPARHAVASFIGVRRNGLDTRFHAGVFMATECTAYRDGKGALHATPEKATLADLAAVLGRVGEEGGMTAGVAKLLLDKRDELERVFAEHDAMIAKGHAADKVSADVVRIRDSS